MKTGSIAGMAARRRRGVMAWHGVKGGRENICLAASKVKTNRRWQRGGSVSSGDVGGSGGACQLAIVKYCAAKVAGGGAKCVWRDGAA